MSYSLTWLPDALEAAGLKVATVDGWESRGRGDMGATRGVICHHTAGSKSGNMPSLRTLVDGRGDLPGPLAHLGLGRDGTYYVVAAGRCNHAGTGAWQGIKTGNSSFIGIEAENTGLRDDPWPEQQTTAYQRGAAAILKRLGATVTFCAGHKEYALPMGRKSDPSFDMSAFRAAVAAYMADGAPTPILIPAVEPPNENRTSRPTLRRGTQGDLVRHVQAKVGSEADGLFGGRTEAAVREFQRKYYLVPDGIVGPKTWRALDDVR